MSAARKVVSISNKETLHIGNFRAPAPVSVVVNGSGTGHLTYADSPLRSHDCLCGAARRPPTVDCNAPRPLPSDGLQFARHGLLAAMGNGGRPRSTPSLLRRRGITWRIWNNGTYAEQPMLARYGPRQ